MEMERGQKVVNLADMVSPTIIAKFESRDRALTPDEIGLMYRVAHMQLTQIQAVYGVVDKVGQMALGQPVLQGAGQELLLLRGVWLAPMPYIKPQISILVSG